MSKGRKATIGGWAILQIAPSPFLRLRVEPTFDIFWQILFLADPDYRSILVPSSIVQSLSLSIWHLHRWFDTWPSEKHLGIWRLCCRRIINRWTDTWSSMQHPWWSVLIKGSISFQENSLTPCDTNGLISEEKLQTKTCYTMWHPSIHKVYLVYMYVV